MPLRIAGLRHEPGTRLPYVVLKASGAAAEELLRRRRRAPAAPPVVKNEALLAQLFRLPLEGEIGPSLYRLVAVLLAHVIAVDASLKGGPLA